MKRLILILVLIFATVSPVFATPTLHDAASSGRVTVLAEDGLDKQAQALADTAEDALAQIRSDLVDLPMPNAIEVRLVRDAADLPYIAPAGRGAPPWAIGVAYPDLGVISIALRRGATIVDAESTLKHELAHIALGVAIGDKAPHWLHEGFAYQHAGEWSWDRMETLAGMAWFGGIVELDQLDRSFPAEELPAHRAYAQSYDFVGYLSRRGRYEDKADDGDRWPFRRFLTIVGQTGDLDAAAKTAFGRPMHELFDEWKEDLTSRYMLAPIGLLGIAIWILCALLLVVAWIRKKRINKKRITKWIDEEQREDAAIAAAMLALRPPPPPDEPHMFN
jgi:hypothetical protein